MEETIKKMVYAGVGLAAQATEKFEKTVTDLVKKGKISDKEGKKIVDDFFSKTEKKKDNFESKFKSTTEEIIEKFNFATKKDVSKLKKKIEQLEKQLKGTKTAAKRTATKKPAAKRTVAKKPAAKKPVAKTATAKPATPAV